MVCEIVQAARRAGVHDRRRLDCGGASSSVSGDLDLERGESPRLTSNMNQGTVHLYFFSSLQNPCGTNIVCRERHIPPRGGTENNPNVTLNMSRLSHLSSVQPATTISFTELFTVMLHMSLKLRPVLLLKTLWPTL